MRRAPSLLALLLVLALAACSTKVKHFDLDPSFTAERLGGDAMAVLGVTLLVPLPEEEDPLLFGLRMNDLLYRTLREKRPDVRALSAGEAAEPVGDSLMQQATDEFRHDGRLRGATVDSLTARLADRCLYVALARINRDEITGERTEQNTTKDGNTEVTGHKYTVKRTMEVTFAVYDLSQRKRVLDAVVAGELQSENTVAVGQDRGDQDWLDKILEALVTDDSNPYPSAPSQESVLRKIMEKFAKELPAAE